MSAWSGAPTKHLPTHVPSVMGKSPLSRKLRNRPRCPSQASRPYQCYTDLCDRQEKNTHADREGDMTPPLFANDMIVCAENLNEVRKAHRELISHYNTTLRQRRCRMYTAEADCLPTNQQPTRGFEIKKPVLFIQAPTQTDTQTSS